MDRLNNILEISEEKINELEDNFKGIQKDVVQRDRNI